MTTSYVMEAIENYDAENAALLGSDDQPHYIFTDQVYTGASYDFDRRRVIYSFVRAVNDDVTNDTGHTLWNGVSSVAPAATLFAPSGWNLWTAVLDIDTRAVTFYEAYSAANHVPNGIGGSDGTWRRYTDTDASAQAQGPRLADPYTGSLWLHTFGSDTPCTIYLLRWGAAEAAFSQIISPLPPHGGSGHMTILGLTADWAYIQSLDGTNFLMLTPREITPAETAADYLLEYAAYAYDGDLDSAYFHTAVDDDGAMYYFASQQTGMKTFALWKFTPPSAFVYPTPPVDGGFTDISPWTTNGPNTGVGSYTLAPSSAQCLSPYDQNLIFKLPATGELVCISKLFASSTGMGVTNPLLFRMDCTYVDPEGGTFDYRPSFITGYMTEAWEPTAVAADAAWSVQDVRELNPFLDASDFAYAQDYTKRWLFVVVQPVVAGVWTPDPATNHVILVQYQFVSGAAPAVLRVIDEAGWDAAYSDYATAIGNTNVVQASMTPGSALYEVYSDTGLYDASDDAFWWAGKVDAMYQLDPSFAPRAEFTGVLTPPFLRLSFGAEPPPIPTGHSCSVWSNIGHPQLRRQIPVPIPQTAPVCTVAPAITGQAIEGNALVVSNGTWTGFPNSFAYQWMRNGSPITDAANASYLLVTADNGTAISCDVTATNNVDPTTASSNSVTPVAPGAPTNTVAPLITGSTVENGTATLSTGTWTGSPSGYAAQWFRGASPITDATGFTYVYVTADVAQNITGKVTASNGSGSNTATSSNTVVPTAAPMGIPIANAAALTSMFAAGVGSSGGKTYLLAGVSFGAFSLSSTDFSSDPVIVIGQSGTVFDYLALDNVHGVTWAAFNASGFGPTGAGIAVENGSSHITFNQVTSNAAVSAGTQSGNGIQVRDSSFITFNGQNDASLPDIYGRGAGVAMLTSANLTFAGMTLQNIEEDGFLIDGVSTGLFDGCLGFDWYAQVGGHPDFFQWFSVAGPNSNITITNSGWLREDGTGVFNGASQGYTGEGDSTNFVLSNNYCFGGLTNSFQQSGGTTTQFDNNFCQGFADYGSRIIVRDGSVNAAVTNNTAGNVFNYAGGGVNPGFSPDPLPGSNTLIGDTTAGNYADLDTWLAAHPTARARPA